MNVTHTKLGLGLIGLSAVLFGSAVLADGRGGPMGPMGMMGMMAPGFDFAAADANKDGKVTPEEFTAYRTAMVAGIDSDKDGKLSADELVAMHMKGMQDRVTRMVQGMIAARDTDGDGKLSAAELVAMPMPADAFQMADTNKDGSVDQAEADAVMQMMMHPHDARGHKHHMGAPDQNGGAQNGGDQTGPAGN